MSFQEHALTFKDAPEGFAHCWRCTQLITAEQLAANLPCPGPPVAPVCALCLSDLAAECACGRPACPACDECHGCHQIICSRCMLAACPEHRPVVV